MFISYYAFYPKFRHYVTDGKGILNTNWRDVLEAWTLLPERRLNPNSFIPYLIVDREQISPSAFILTVEPRRFCKNWNTISVNRGTVQKPLENGLWCVEIKQPQLQVARDYTPLPVPVGLDEEKIQDDIVWGRLRFLIRKMEGGEVSSYLSKLQVGDRVELRGPHLGFNVAERLGLERTDSEVVFLAGGTGIAPALQVARRLYGPVYAQPIGLLGKFAKVEDTSMPAAPPKMTIVWANRNREDCPDCEEVEALRKRGYLPPAVSVVDATKTGGIMSYLQDVKAHNPEHFNFVCTVDAEKKFIDANAILDAVASTKTSKSSALTAANVADPSCPLHSSFALVNVSDRQDHEAKCQCPSHAVGKNLLMVSGPEGFVAKFAGAKAWSEGLERQGNVGGVVAELMKKGKLNGQDWMVLKL